VAGLVARHSIFGARWSGQDENVRPLRSGTFDKRVVGVLAALALQIRSRMDKRLPRLRFKRV
jgi:hypothetical protein